MTDKAPTLRAWSSIIADEARRHPGMSVRDLYKLVYQGCYGGDHLLRDPDRFLEVLAQEWDHLPAETARETALQPIHPSGKVARLHLAPCKTMGVPRYALAQLLLQQPLRAGHREAYDWAWATVLHSARSAEIPFLYEEVVQFVPPDGAPHHSPEYGQASYRIINHLDHGPTREGLCRLGILR
jgi:hypothetical protein